MLLADVLISRTNLAAQAVSFKVQASQEMNMVSLKALNAQTSYGQASVEILSVTLSVHMVRLVRDNGGGPCHKICRRGLPMTVTLKTGTA